jgi:hypothetical protein
MATGWLPRIPVEVGGAAGKRRQETVEILRLKVRLSVLWICLAVAMSASMLLALLGPGVIDEIMEGQMEGWQITAGLLSFFTLFWLIPLAMAFLSVTLRDNADRWANLVAGIVFTVFYIGHLLGHLMQGQLALNHLILGLAQIVLAALICWYAWRWPKQET